MRDEIDFFKAVSYEITVADRVVIRDIKSYCESRLDDDNRKPICRLHFNNVLKYLEMIANKTEDCAPNQ